MARIGPLAGLLLVCAFTAACSNLVSIEPTGNAIDLGPQLQTSVLTADDGAVLAELHAEQDRELVPLAAIPQVVRDAVVAVEDARFYEHTGVDGRAIARALVTNLVEGEIRQGGSTITQQLVKNAVVGDDETLERKLAEASIALQLEAQLTKDEILEQYLNTVYFGGGAYGVGAAARRYFDVDVSQVDLAQAALLAGVLRAPSRYDPRDNPGEATARRNLVLGLMAEQQLITHEQALDAQRAPLDVAPPPVDQDWQHPYAVAHAMRELQHDPVFHVLGATPQERAIRLFGGGLQIETTIDVGVQRDAEAAVADVLIDPARDPGAALVAIDPPTGHIRALVGGRDYNDPDDPVARFNLATIGRRQPGSSFKPLVLAAAIESGWSLEDSLPAPATLTLPGANGAGDWVVSNAGGAGYGDLTLRTATALSVNVVYARLVQEIGPESVIDVARRVGITSPLTPLGSIALGAQEVSPLEMATAMATLAAGGVHHPPTIIRRITDADGVVIWEDPDDQGERALDERVAGQVTLAMQDVVTVGTGTGAALGRPVAGKTGTSQDNADAWFIGFTPDLAVAVWVGFPEGRVAMVPPRTRVQVQGGGWPAEIFARFGTAALHDTVATPFDGGGDLVTVLVDLSRDCLPNDYTPRHLMGERGYVVGSEPGEICAEPSGPPTVDVPPVVGMRVEQAREALHAAGFTVVEQPQFATEVPGTVLSQSPASGVGQVLSETGYTATLAIASADRTGTVVPDVLNQSLDIARQTLEAQGFNVEVRVQCPDEALTCSGSVQRPGVVWQQTPDATAPVRHSLITLWAYPA